ncbi:hypothetical protein TVAG_450630 [Trichomonas vaginalis G3]|uniref:Uncharacterized protein n=1 Tax=Trichomonas vaginalis (strain ATCC PRA-98 / G3) TaxID=412133 RepID=A2EV40_TRIV3|nr:hypothetical protein TVAGG3_0946300 [Trichomonas vaginalis G3]EAY03490.1 hypothetical protein TVAG_450630 [Trichomonas vaginalis G3]KAI5486899.1 hypothetical protein TVAGG3_0946300 [Trichomonas vaginalis G3]|eukprot:XP_001315713.1 hypothetical protein [Trichomonas vaginalis G3]
MDSLPEAEKETKTSKGKEGRIIERELKNFDYLNCTAWKALRAQFSSGVRHPELLSIASILSRTLDLPEVTRSGKRSFKVLIKWFDDNWDKISSIIRNITLLDANECPISGQREYCELYK